MRLTVDVELTRTQCADRSKCGNVQYALRNIEMRSRYRCYCGKAITIACSECVSVALGVQHAQRITVFTFHILSQINPTQTLPSYFPPTHYPPLLPTPTRATRPPE